MSHSPAGLFVDAHYGGRLRVPFAGSFLDLVLYDAPFVDENRGDRSNQVADSNWDNVEVVHSLNEQEKLTGPVLEAFEFDKRVVFSEDCREYVGIGDPKDVVDPEYVVGEQPSVLILHIKLHLGFPIKLQVKHSGWVVDEYGIYAADHYRKIVR